MIRLRVATGTVTVTDSASHVGLVMSALFFFLSACDSATTNTEKLDARVSPFSSLAAMFAFLAVSCLVRTHSSEGRTMNKEPFVITVPDATLTDLRERWRTPAGLRKLATTTGSTERTSPPSKSWSPIGRRRMTGVSTNGR